MIYYKGICLFIYTLWHCKGEWFFSMDPSSTWLIVLYLFLVVCSAYFSASEMAFSSLSKIKLLSFRDENPKRVDLCLRIQEKYDEYLVTLLIGNNLVNIGCAAVSTILTGRMFTLVMQSGASVADGVVTAISTAVTTVIIFMFGETIPKRIAKDKTEQVAMFSAPYLRLFSVIFYPISFIFRGISALVNRFVKVKAEPTVTEEELSDIIETSGEEGVLDEEQSELMQSALEFSETLVSDVLTLRDDVVWIDLSCTAEQVMEKVQHTKYSRLPVCVGTLDKCVGVLIVNDFLKAYIAGSYTGLKSLIRKPFFTDLDASIDDLKDEMSGKRQHLALVKDRKKKSIIGVVTIEDFLEELVGEIFDESDTVDDNFMKLGGNYFEVSGRLPVTEMFRRIGYRPVKPVAGHKPVSTWVLEQLGSIPEEDDSFTYEDLTITVDQIEQNRVSRLTVKLADPMIDPPADADGEDSAEKGGEQR